MPAIYGVAVPTDAPINYPSWCVICGEKHEGKQIKLQANPVGYFGLWKWQFGLNRKLDIPLHSPCGSAIRKSLIRRQIFLLVFTALAFALSISFDWGRLETLGFALVLMTPVFLWQFHNPPEIEFTENKSATTFNFRDIRYAREFANLNSARFYVERP